MYFSSNKNQDYIPYHLETVGDKLLRTFDKFADVPVSPSQILHHLRKLIGNNTLVTASKNIEIENNTINISAYYDPEEDQLDEKPFEVVLIFNPDDKTVTLDRKEWHDFCALMIDYLQHEMIHQYQYQARDYVPGRNYKSKHPDPVIKNKQEYQGNADEIEAYSANLASELLRKTNNDYDHVLRLLRYFTNTAHLRDQGGRLLSPTLYGYLKDFDFDTNSPVIKNLLKKTYNRIILNKKQKEKQDRILRKNQEAEEKIKSFTKRN